jgi:hypothetical protein
VSKKEAIKLQKRLAAEGKAIEGGWIAFRMVVIPPDAPQVQIDSMHLAYMAGAQHLFLTIIAMFDPGSEATPADMDKMSMIAKELDTFAAEVRDKYARK